MADTITKNDANSVTITKTVAQVVDYETLVAQRAGIVAQKTQYLADRLVQDKMWADALASIDSALGMGISSKPAVKA